MAAHPLPSSRPWSTWGIGEGTARGKTVFWHTSIVAIQANKQSCMCAVNGHVQSTFLSTFSDSGAAASMPPPHFCTFLFPTKVMQPVMPPSLLHMHVRDRGLHPVIPTCPLHMPLHGRGAATSYAPPPAAAHAYPFLKLGMQRVKPPFAAHAPS